MKIVMLRRERERDRNIKNKQVVDEPRTKHFF
jgi:hypothetical protein